MRKYKYRILIGLLFCLDVKCNLGYFVMVGISLMVGEDLYSEWLVNCE